MGGDLHTEPKEEEFLTALNNYHNNSTSGSHPLLHNNTSVTRPHISRPKTHPSISNNKPSVSLEVCPSSEYQPFNIAVPPRDNCTPNCAQDISETCNSGCEFVIYGSSICNSGSDNCDLRNGSNSCTSGNESYNCNLGDELGNHIESNSCSLKDRSGYYDSENRPDSHNLDNGADYYNSETGPNNCDSGNGPENYTPGNSYDLESLSENYNLLSGQNGYNSILESYNSGNAFIGYNSRFVSVGLIYTMPTIVFDTDFLNQTPTLSLMHSPIPMIIISPLV